jgi:hypothetical protein
MDLDGERLSLSQVMRASTSESLPGDYVAFTARRLGYTTAAAAALECAYFILYRTVFVASSNALGMLTGIAGIVVSIAVAAYLLSVPRPAAAVVRGRELRDLCLVHAGRVG